MKTHLKLTVTFFVVVLTVYFLINRNNKKNLIKEDSIAMLQNAVSLSDENPKVDSLTFKKLIPFFKIHKDEFDPYGTIRYSPKNSPEKPKGDAIFCYFDQIKDSVANLRVRMQIQNKEWLFYKKCQFLIDGKIYDYSPINIELNEGAPGFVCEWFDEVIDKENMEIIKALSQAKAAKVKIFGRHYDKIIVFSKDQLSLIDHTLDLYSAMNGEIVSR